MPRRPFCPLTDFNIRRGLALSIHQPFTGKFHVMLNDRRLEPEWMDQPDIDKSLHKEALFGLERINRISRSAELLWYPIERFLQQHDQRRLRLLDIASGGGDVLIALAKRATKAGVSLELVGCDMSETAVEHARRSANTYSADVRFEQRDVLVDPPRETYDIVTCSLFLHHLSSEQAVTLLRTMSRAATGLLLVNDLIRCRMGYLLAEVACRVLTRSPVVRVDGPRSVAGAFTVSEVQDLCRQVPLPGATIVRRWPARFVLEWRGEHGH